MYEIFKHQNRYYKNIVYLHNDIQVGPENRMKSCHFQRQYKANKTLADTQ